MASIRSTALLLLAATCCLATLEAPLVAEEADAPSSKEPLATVPPPPAPMGTEETVPVSPSTARPAAVPIAATVFLARLTCLKNQEGGHDEIFFLTRGRRVPLAGGFELEDDGSRRSVYDQYLWHATLKPGTETTATIELWEQDGGGNHDDFIGSVTVYLANRDGTLEVTWQPRDAAQASPERRSDPQRFQLTGSDARYEVALGVSAKPFEPTATRPAGPRVITPEPSSTVVVVPIRRRIIFAPRPRGIIIAPGPPRPWSRGFVGPRGRVRRFR